ncbi:MAG: tRNA lysidine(34) synthetase TilS [Chloroflexota bacterium]|nr:tRNA lysidine(34) synthetase TilS [Chloroflexota bacterium]
MAGHGEEDLERRVHRFIADEGLVEAGETVVVGVSGGADSVCLLHLLYRLQGALGVGLHVAHLDHGLRGAAAAADARYVGKLARHLGLPATIDRRDVRAYRAGRRLSVEEAARRVRYQFFAEVAQEVGAGRIALGHTADDQVETVLMHLVRGAGLAGLRGMRPMAAWGPAEGGATLSVVRPLLAVARAETEAYCAAQGLEPRQDATNYSPAFLRNRFRHEVLPLLRQYNPQVDDALLRLADAAAADLSFIEGQVAQVWGDVVREEGGGLLLDRAAVSSLHPALRRHLLRRVLVWLKGDTSDIEWVHVEAMVAALSGPAGKGIDLPHGLAMTVGYDACLVAPRGIDTCPFPPLEGEHVVSVPGETEVPGWRVCAHVVSRDERAWGFATCLDLEQVGTDLVVRTRRPGDRFQPLGMAESKKLQDFMVDAKVARAWRDRVPLVVSPRGIVWVVGWRIDERARVREDTEHALRIEFQRV